MRALAFILLLGGPLTGVASAQSASDVHVPAIEIATALSYDLQRDGTADLPGGAGAIVAVSGNIHDHVAIVTQLANSPRMQTMMAGGRVSTGFYREGPGAPGRFFAELLAGPRRGGVAGSGSAIQLGVGSDALIVPRGLSLHLALDYLVLPGARHDFAGARFSVGLVVGPHRAKSQQLPKSLTGGQETRSSGGKVAASKQPVSLLVS